MGQFEPHRLRELLRKRVRINVHAKRRVTFRISAVVNSDRSVLLHSGAGPIGFLGGRHPLASLLSSMDVHCYDRVELSPNSVGVFYGDLCRGLVELRKHFRNHVLFQWPPKALSMGSHRPYAAPGFAHRGACMVRKSDCHTRLCLGVFSTADENSGRRRQTLVHLRSHNRVFRFRYGSVPASLSRHLPSTVTPASALTGFRVVTL